MTLGVQDVVSVASLEAAGLARTERGFVAPADFYAHLGVEPVESMDLLPDEGATIIHDLALPIPQEQRGRYGLVIDGGTLEHIPDIWAALGNVARLLAVGGRVVHVTPVCGWNNHGFYCPQPKLFFRTYLANGFRDVQGWLLHLPRDGGAARVEPIAPDAGVYEADSRRERTLLFLTAVLGREGGARALHPPLDTHLTCATPATTECAAPEAAASAAPPPSPPPSPAGGFHPGAWAGRLLARGLGDPRLRRLLLNGLSPQQRVDLALEALEWGELHDQVAWGALGRFAGHLRRSTPEAERLGLELARAVSPTTRSRMHESLRALTEQDDRSLAYALRAFRGLHETIATHAGRLAGQRILELGPGYTLIPGLLLVASGAASWVGADLHPLASLEAGLYRRFRREVEEDRDLVRGPEHYAARRALLTRLDQLLTCEGERVVVDERRVAWRHPVDAGQLPFADRSFELVLSNATLEHVRDPDAAARESLRVLAAGGLGLHQIDLRDHRDFSRPLDFLCLSAAAWEGRFAPVPAGGGDHSAFTYTNRWRKSDFVGAFERAGGVVRSCTSLPRVPVDDALRRGLDPDFRHRSADDLETVSVQLVVQRPDQPGSPGA